MVSHQAQPKEANTEVDEDEKWRLKRIKSYFEHKVGRYARQDFEAGRLKQKTTDTGLSYDFKEEFVNVKWLESCINKCCSGCGCHFSLDFDEDFRVESDITAQKLDNSLPHYINNIIPMCINCNCSNK